MVRVGGGGEREHSIDVRIECGSRWWVQHALVVATVGAAVAITITNRSTMCVSEASAATPDISTVRIAKGLGTYGSIYPGVPTAPSMVS